MKLLAAPYDKMSDPLPDLAGEPAREVISPFCFAASLARGEPVPLVRGHDRAGRRKRDWRIARVECFEESNGLFFSFDGTLPNDFSGFSVKFAPIRWRRIGPQTFRLTEARLKHIALLEMPDVPAYPQTYSHVRSLLCPIQ